MPVHDFKCPTCQHEFEQYQSPKNLDSPVKCPVCGAVARKRFRLSRAGIRVPFYVDLPDGVVDKIERSTEKQGKGVRARVDLGRFGKP